MKRFVWLMEDLKAQIDALKAEVTRLRSELVNYNLWSSHAALLAEVDHWKSLAMRAKEALEYTQINWVEKEKYGNVAKRDVVKSALAAFPTEEK